MLASDNLLIINLCIIDVEQYCIIIPLLVVLSCHHKTPVTLHGVGTAIQIYSERREIVLLCPCGDKDVATELPLRFVTILCNS